MLQVYMSSFVAQTAATSTASVTTKEATVVISGLRQKSHTSAVAVEAKEMIMLLPTEKTLEKTSLGTSSSSANTNPSSNTSSPAANTTATRKSGSVFHGVEHAKKTEDSTRQELLTEFQISTTPDPNVPTLAYFHRSFYSGFRNQGMVFSGFVMYAAAHNFTQILLPTIRWKDLFGTNKLVDHEKLFDVLHWNSFNAGLPRFVTFDPVAHQQYHVKKGWLIDNPEVNATQPYAHGRYQRMTNQYKQYTKKLQNQYTQYTKKPSLGLPKLNSADQAMMRGAFKPHPDLQKHIDGLHGGSEDSYMALHARIEPDMQKHPVCRDLKVIKLQTIFDSMQAEFPEPPASKLFIAVNRPMLEKEVADPKIDNEIAAENLAVLNRASMEGLWGGKVTVFEAGMPSVETTKFAAFPGISGSIVDYFLAVGATVFFGTSISSFSTDLIAARFYRGNSANYHYLPSGLEMATMPNSTIPPRFHC
jgi:hypothetical protein